MIVWVIGRALPQTSNLNLGSFEFDQAKALATRGIEVFYPEVNFTKGFFIFKASKRIIESVNVVSVQVPLLCLFPKIIQIKFQRRILVLFLRFMTSYCRKPNVIHVHYPSIYPYSVFKRYQDNGVRIVATEHWSRVLDNTLPKKSQKYLTDFANKSDSFICVSNILKEAVIRITGTKKSIAVVPNLVSDFFSNLSIPRERRQEFCFIAVSRLTAIKRFDLLIRAFVQAFSGCSNIKLNIVGNGEEFKALQNLIYSLKVQNNIKLLGYVDPSEIKKLYMKSDALVVSSALETFSVPVIEAMSCGLPVVVTKNIGIVDYIDNRNGIVIENDSIEAFAEAMKQMVLQKNCYDPNEIMRIANYFFNRDNVTASLLREYGMDK